jgi:hypothetical protein
LTVKGKRLLKSHVCKKCREVWCSVEIYHDALSTMSECPKLNILIRRKKE